MNVAAALRGVGVLAVVGAVLDPGCPRQRRPIVEVAFAGPVPERDRAHELSRIAEAAPWGTVIDAEVPPALADGSAPAARVVSGEAAYVLDALQRRGADLASALTSPALVLEHISVPARVVAGVRTDIVVGVAGVPAGQGLVRVVVTDAASGVEQARGQVGRKGVAPAGSVQVSVPWLATGEGSIRLRVQASFEPAGALRPSPPGDAVVDVQGGRVDVSTLEGRPTWAGRFARLSLADQSGIDLRTEVRVTPGVAVRTAPLKAAPSHAHPQVILVSGVEALTSADVGRLEAGVRERGQAVVLLMDEPPGAGPWRRLWPAGVGPLRTTSTPVIGRVAGHAWKMREWLAAPVSTAVTALASLETGSAPFVLGRALGAGRVVLVSAVDAWRWRGDADVAFASGWRALVRRLAADVPPVLTATAWVSGHGRRRLVQVDVVLRPDLANGSDTSVGARWGSLDEPLALQQLEPGRWRGAFRASAATSGPLVVQARAAQRLIGEARAVIDVSPAAPVGSWGDVVRHQSWRGQLSTGSSLLPALMAQVRDALPPAAPDRWYVTRTWWFAFVVLTALGAEWILRRLAGGR